MAMTLKQLEEQLTMDTYTPKTDEQIQADAENRFQTQYDQQRTAEAAVRQKGMLQRFQDQGECVSLRLQRLRLSQARLRGLPF